VSWLHGLAILLRVVANSLDGSDGVVSRANPIATAYVAYARAVTLGREGRHEDALAAIAQADAAMPPGWRRAHARLLVARSAFESGWGDPTRWIRESLAFLDSKPLPRFAAACKASLRRVGAPVPRRGRGESPVPGELQELGVTSREMDVLRLVGERLSNRDIGARLYLSPRTIEDHVASLKYKLSAGTRRELVDHARRHEHGLPANPEASRT
jgi:DNA-binding CsgD family transcriptional regulator